MRSPKRVSVAVSLVFLIFTVEAKTPRNNAIDQSNALQGIWETVKLTKDGVSIDSQMIGVWSGKRCYWIDSAAPGVVIGVQEAHFPAVKDGQGLDLMNPNDNSISRYLYDLKKDVWTLYSSERPVRRPDKIAPTADAGTVHVFKRLGGPVLPGSNKHTFSGLWETIGYELDGVKLEETNKEHFRRCKKAFYFQEDVYTLIGTDEVDLQVVHKPCKIRADVGKHAIDFVAEDDKAIQAIYKTEGDTLVICWNHQGGPRPDQFRTAQGDGRALIRLKRVDDPTLPLQHEIPPDQINAPPRKAASEQQLAPHQGVWQQVRLLNHEGQLDVNDPPDFELKKRLAIWNGGKCYWIRSAAFGLFVTLEEPQIHPGGQRNALDFVDPSNNRTVRCRYELDNDTWTLCLHSRFKTVQQPAKIAATEDGFAVHVFKRLPGPARQASDKSAQALFGVWNTVGSQVNGVEIKKMENSLDFGKNQRMFYFQPELYTVCWADAGPLRVVHNRYEMKPNVSKEAIDFAGETSRLSRRFTSSTRMA